MKEEAQIKKLTNEVMVLHFFQEGETNESKIARILGISSATVSNYKKELIRKGLIHENGIDVNEKQKSKEEIIQEKVRKFEEKIQRNIVTASDALALENLITNNSDSINADIARIVIIGLLKTGGKDGFKMACDFYDKCIELVGDDKAKRTGLQGKIKPFLNWHKARIDAANMISKMIDHGGTISLYEISSRTGLDVTEVLKIKELIESQRRRFMQKDTKKIVTKNNNSGQER